METKASYVAVGSFVLILMVAMVAFVIWLTGSSLTQSADLYRIYFTGAVTGLQEGSQVQYQGIPVGTVTDVRLDPANVERVETTVAIEPGTPIVQGTIAALSQAGLTGGVFVQLSGGMTGAAPLVATNGEPYPVIPSRQSGLQAIFQSVPELLEKLSDIATRISAVFSDDNQRAITDILVNVNSLTEALSTEATRLGDTGRRVDALVANLDGLVANLDGLVTEARGDLTSITDKLDTLLTTANGQIQVTGADVTRLVDTLNRGADQITGILVESRPGLEDFTTEGLYEVTLLVSELRGLADSLSRFIDRISRDPSQLIFPETDRGVPTGSNR